MKYILTSEEQQEVVDLVHQIEIDETNSSYYRRNPVDNRQSKKEAQKQSFGAEIAFCKLVGAKPDLELHKNTILIDTIVNGQKVDIKQTKYFNGKLIVKETDTKNSPIDVYALVIGTFPNYDYKGWAYKSEIIQEKNIKNLGYPNSNPYCLDQDKLHTEEIHG